MVYEVKAKAETPAVSVIVATHDRVSSLCLLLEGLSHVHGREKVPFEVIVANNARNEAIANSVTETALDCFGGLVVRVVREPMPGKCRAQNRAIREARGSILAFLDDDVKVTPEWLESLCNFFNDETFDAMQGSILMPPEAKADPAFLKAYHRFRTIDFIDYGSKMREIRTLTGANMAMRREVFAKIGLFNEQLGPGCSGISEDVEFAQRLLRSGGRIGYKPGAAVYHEADRKRLTEEFFRLRHEQQGRSRLVYKKQSIVSIVSNLIRSVGSFGWYSVLGNERKKYRAKGRYHHYRAMFEVKIKKLAGARL